LINRVADEAPGSRLRFVQKPDKDSAQLRNGSVDLETGVAGTSTSPELCTHALFRDQFIGVVRTGHPLSRGAMTRARYMSGKHISAARRDIDTNPIDAALAPLGLQRQIATTVAGFATAIALARASDLIATVPERHTAGLRIGMHSFALPFTTREVTISMIWHPRLDADPAHRWLRTCVQETCAVIR
jgi:DNA-binding transcriptional LysR family regulator